MIIDQEERYELYEKLWRESGTTDSNHKVCRIWWEVITNDHRPESKKEGCKLFDKLWCENG